MIRRRPTRLAGSVVAVVLCAGLVACAAETLPPIDLPPAGAAPDYQLGAAYDGALTLDDNLAQAELLVDTAHDAGLAAGQKNAAEDAAMLKKSAGFDFAVAEECAVYDECGLYADVYGDHVIGVEYSDTGVDFAAACAEPSAPASLVLRDRELVGPDDDAYVFALCDGPEVPER